jgi:hypothetical protein
VTRHLLVPFRGDAHLSISWRENAMSGQPPLPSGDLLVARLPSLSPLAVNPRRSPLAFYAASSLFASARHVASPNDSGLCPQDGGDVRSLMGSAQVSPLDDLSRATILSSLGFCCFTHAHYFFRTSPFPSSTRPRPHSLPVSRLSPLSGTSPSRIYALFLIGFRSRDIAIRAR